LDQLQGKRRANDLSAQAKNVQFIIFNALVRGEDIVNESGAYPGNFVCSDRGADCAAAKGDRVVDEP